MLQVGNIENDIDVGLGIRAAHLHIPDVGFGVADHRRNLFQHAETIVAENRKLHRIGTGRSLIASPLDIDAAFRLIQQVDDVGAIHGVNGDAFAASYVTYDILAPDGVAASRPVHEQIAMAFDADSVVATVSAENPADHAGNATRLFSLTVGGGGGRARRQTRQHLPGRVFSVSDPGHQVVNLAQAIVGGDLAQLFVLDLLQRDPVLARFLLDQLAADFDGALALMNVEPVLDLVAGARRLDNSQPIAARLVPRLSENLHDVSAVQFVTQRHHAPVDLGAHATVTDFGVNGVGKIDGRGLPRQHHNLALGREGVHLFRIQVDLKGGKEFGRIRYVSLPLDHLPQPGQSLFVLGRDWAIFVLPVRRDAFFGHAVHFLGSNLHFERGAILGDHRGMQRLIKIWPRHGDEILDSSGDGAPQVVHDPQYGVAVRQ